MKKAIFVLVLLFTCSLWAQSGSGINSGTWTLSQEWGAFAEAWSNNGDNIIQQADYTKTKYLVVTGDVYLEHWLLLSANEGHYCEASASTYWYNINTYQYGDVSAGPINNNSETFSYSNPQSTQICTASGEEAVRTDSEVHAEAWSNNYDPNPHAYAKASIIYYW